MRNRKTIFLAVFVTFLWGSAFPAVKIGYDLFGIHKSQIFDILIFAGYRFFAAGMLVAFAASIKRKGIALPKINQLPGIAALGFVQITLQYLCFYIGVAYISGTKSSVLYSVNTLAAAILAHFLSKNDKLTSGKLGGCALGLAGIIVINAGGTESEGHSFLGELLVISAAVAFAAGGILNKKMAGQVEEYTLTAYQLMFGAAVLIICGYRGGGSLSFQGPGTVGILLYLAAVSAAAFLIWTCLLKGNKVSSVTIYNFLIPIFGVVLSSGLLKEPFLQIKNILALALVCSGIILANIEKKTDNR